MRPNRWIITTVSAILLATAAIAGLNMMLDIYGLYRPGAGRRLAVPGDERVTKYLLSLRYVPENFNAMLTGASITANWDVKAIDNLRVYNGSLNGGNIIEEKSLIEAALQRPGLSVVLLLVHPALTFSHEFHTVEMKPELQRSALGSLSLLHAYKDMINIRLGRMPDSFDYAGTETFLDTRSEMNIAMKQMWDKPDFTVDAAALEGYLDLVADLRARGVQIVFIVPPTSEDLLRAKRVPMENYLRRMRSAIGAGDLWIDFLSPEYEEFCRNRANFSDGVHLMPDGARQVVSHLNTAVNHWIAERRILVREP